MSALTGLELHIFQIPALHRTFSSEEVEHDSPMKAREAFLVKVFIFFNINLTIDVTVLKYSSKWH